VRNRDVVNGMNQKKVERKAAGAKGINLKDNRQLLGRLFRAIRRLHRQPHLKRRELVREERGGFELCFFFKYVRELRDTHVRSEVPRSPQGVVVGGWELWVRHWRAAVRPQDPICQEKIPKQRCHQQVIPEEFVKHLRDETVPCSARTTSVPAAEAGRAKVWQQHCTLRGKVFQAIVSVIAVNIQLSWPSIVRRSLRCPGARSIISGLSRESRCLRPDAYAHRSDVSIGVVRQDVKRSAGSAGSVGRFSFAPHAASWMQSSSPGAHPAVPAVSPPSSCSFRLQWVSKAVRHSHPHPRQERKKRKK
jgi:hypothetical protein